MQGSMTITKKQTPGVQPLAVSRRTMAIIVMLAIVLWSIGFLLWWQVEIDKWLLLSHNGLRTNEFAVDISQVFSGYGMALIVLIYFLYLLFAFKNEKLRDAYRIYLFLILMFGIAAVGGSVLKEVFDRPRPFVELAGEINALSNAQSDAFPSGHAAKSVALALPFIILITVKDNWHKGIKVLLAILAFGVCYSRVVLGAHYVSDVLAGAGLALICFPLIAFLNNKILSVMPQERFNFAIKVWAVILFVLMVYLIVQ